MTSSSDSSIEEAASLAASIIALAALRHVADRLLRIGAMPACIRRRACLVAGAGKTVEGIGDLGRSGLR